jgi:hypothetical protein
MHGARRSGRVRGPFLLGIGALRTTAKESVRGDGFPHANHRKHLDAGVTQLLINRMREICAAVEFIAFEVDPAK